MSFINEVYLRTWVQLTRGYNQGGWSYIYGKPEGAGWLLMPPANAALSYLLIMLVPIFSRENYWTANHAIP